MKRCCCDVWISFGLSVMLVSACSAQFEHRGIVLDATTKHVVITGGLSEDNLRLGERDARVMMQLQRRRPIISGAPAAARKGESVSFSPIDLFDLVPLPAIAVQGQNPTNLPGSNPRVDWSVNLGAGNVAPQQSPAKYGLNPDGQPDCVNDYVVFALNVAGVTGGQANLVGINELYSGTDPTGYCGKNPNVNWAYNGSTAGGAVLTSPVISLDGTKISYVESTSSSSIFHVLTWQAGQGTKATNAASPTPVGSCTATTSCLTSLTYSTTSTTTLASTWVDYGSDKGYAASDDGNVYRISCVFLCPLNANPTVDWVFTLPVAGTGGALPVPTIPVYDGSTYLFVADQLGEVWSIDVAGSTPVLAAGPVMVGGGGCGVLNPPGRTGGMIHNPCQATGGSYGIPDGTMLVEDGSSASDEIFVFSGNNGVKGASAVVEQLSYDLSVQAADSVGIGSYGNTTTNVDLHIGAFDNVFENGDATQGHLFLCGTGTTDTTSTQPWDYWIGFTNYPVMDSTPTQAAAADIPTNGAPCTGFIEFYNPNIELGSPNSNDHDLLMSGVVDPTNGALILDDISDGAILLQSQGGDNPLDFAYYPGGISNIVMDNEAIPSGYPQADSMYFSTLEVVTEGTCSNARCAVKISQTQTN